MTDFRALIIGVFGGLIVLGLRHLYNLFQNRSNRQDLEFWEYEKKHLEEMKRSSVEMNRSTFNGLFGILMFMALGHIIPNASIAVGLDQPKTVALLQVIVWGLVLGLSIKYAKRYYNLKNYKEALENMDGKILKIKAKLEKS